MATDMGSTPPVEPMGTGGGSQSNRQRNIIIAVVVVVILLCCCCIAAAGGYWLYQNGDSLLGTQSRLLPLLMNV